MVARCFKLTIVVLCCGLTSVLGIYARSAVAAPVFGGFGEEAGQVHLSQGIAVDRATGDVYVSDNGNNRIDKFDASGKFVSAWGWGVADGAEELQTCTSSCQRGNEGRGNNFGGAGLLCGPWGVAVDNDPSSPSQGDVYVVSGCGNDVEKFDSSGAFLSMFGGHVNKATDGDVCAAGEACQAATSGMADGEFEWEREGNFIAVGPGGAVYVGDRARIEVFDSAGVWREDVSLASLSLTGTVTALAVNSTGDMFVKDDGVPGVRELAPSGIEIMQIDAGSESVDSLALDAVGDLFVSDTTGGIHFLEYASAGKELESFGAKTPLTQVDDGMAFDEASGKLLVYGRNENENGFSEEGTGVWEFALPTPGPLIEPGSESAVPGQRGVARLEAAVNPEGLESTYRFEYVDEAHFQVAGYAGASSSPSGTVGSTGDFDEEAVTADLTGLVPGGTYHYRLVATNASGTTNGPDHTFTTVAPMLVDGPWVADVAATSATLVAQIDPLGSRTEYRLEYGTSTTYGQTLSGSVGEGTSYVPIDYHRQELLPDTVYHYRLVTSNEVGIVESADHTFTTQPVTGQEFVLPDGRDWELVSPPDKAGGLIEPFNGGQIQAATDGSGIAYVTTQPLGYDPRSNPIFSATLSTRGPGGWHSEDISPPYSIPKGEAAIGLFNATNGVELLSSDLSSAIIEPAIALVSFSLSPEAPERTTYLRDNANGSYIPLVNDNNVPPGTKYDGKPRKSTSENPPEINFAGATPDLEHVFLTSGEALTPDAVPPECDTCNAPAHLFEWSAGQLQQVSILPDGKPAPGGAVLGCADRTAGSPVSNDGRRIVWSEEKCESGGALYVRDLVEGKTWRIGGPRAEFEAMSKDGSKVFVFENGELYEFTTVTDTRIDLTAAHGAAEGNAGVKDGVLGASADGSFVYFVAYGVLAPGGVSGSPNVYLLHEANGSWSTAFIATLSSEDEKDWSGNRSASRTARVSPNGRYLAFMSETSLTGYDNLDANSGLPDEEVYEYDATTGHLACVSCDPTGARPIGVQDVHGEQLLVDRGNEWGENNGRGPHWLAGLIPGWRYGNSGRVVTVHQPRYLSDSGRLLFDSPDALVPRDTNGLMDVYEYEPSGAGGCTVGSSVFSVRSDGCVSLLSAGTSSGESAFMDASESGDDVFFVTASRLTATDYDNAYDLYDAHVCSQSVPCHSEPVSPPPCSSGDSCKAAPSPQPELFGSAPSATFSGNGNIVVSSVSGVVPKSLTRAQKLARALAICHKDKHKAKRIVCERRAKKRYPTRRSGGANAKKGKR